MIETFAAGTLGTYDYVVMMTRYRGRLLLSRHKNRTTWEMQGGHIESGESPEEAARRELFEESGALCFDLSPLCDYSGEEPGKHNNGQGMVFRAEVQALGPLPESEMAEILLFEELPGELTYPQITKAIFDFCKAADNLELSL